MAIITSTEEWGTSTIVRSDPLLSKINSAIYVPYKTESQWGLYHDHGAIIDEAVDYRGRERAAHQDTRPIDVSSKFERLSRDYCYFYGGSVHLHYGHFLISSLARFWPFSTGNRKNYKIIIHFPGSIADLFSVEAIAVIFKELGLGKESFVIPTQPVRLSEVLVPSTSFAEQNFAHEVYRNLAIGLGTKLRIEETIHTRKTPIFLSKERLKVGVGQIVNESIIVDIVRRAGFTIVYPELLSFRDQLCLFSRGAPITGTATSAMHTSIFSQEKNMILCISPALAINSNFIMIDKLASNDSIYIYDDGTEIVDGDGFLTSRKLANPVEIADYIIELSKQKRA